MSWLARAALVVTLMTLAAWFVLFVLDTSWTPLVVIGAVAAVTLLIRLGRLHAVSRNESRRR